MDNSKPVYSYYIYDSTGKRPLGYTGDFCRSEEELAKRIIRHLEMHPEMKDDITVFRIHHQEATTKNITSEYFRKHLDN